jgi:carbonic anhydrase
MKLFIQMLIFVFLVSLGVVSCKKTSTPAPTEDKAKSEEKAEASEPKEEHSEEAKEEHKPHWTYEGEGGPANWGSLDDAFKLCASGTAQSPIDIVGAESSEALPELALDYKASKVNVVNNGHTVQVNMPEGSSVTIGDKTYALAQFHFHSPSEHTVDGNPYALEMHLVHKSESGDLAVVGLLFKKGAENPFIKSIFDHLPTEVGKPVDLETEININDVIPAEKNYFHYTGSLTTPPCSEGVNWNVIKAELEVSEEQAKQFNDLIKNNNRPVQPLSDRKIEVK